MRTYRLGPKSTSDLAEIFETTVDTWGELQAENYVDDLGRCFQLLANSPGLGRACDRIFPGMRRFEQGKHVIFYRPDKTGILISRILHQKMLPSQTLFMGA